MNFSLHKTFSKKYFYLFLFFLSLVIGFSRCVPIEDLVDPTVGEFTLQEQYNVSDTIILEAILADNFGISKYTIDIEAVNEVGLWSYTSTDSVKARLLNLKDTIIIPSENFAIGNYELTLTVFDASGKNKITTKNFSVGKDANEPVFTFPNNILPELDSIGVNSYRACPSEDRINIKGIASDNIGLDKIIAKFEGLGIRDSVFLLQGRTFVDLAKDVFPNGLTIPNESEGTTIKLQLRAVDLEGNSSPIFEISILATCDDPPVIGQIFTNPNKDVNEEGKLEIIQGQALFITNAIITDDNELDKIVVYFKARGEERIIAQKDTSGINSTSLQSLFRDISVPIPANPSDLEEYEIKIKVIDSGGNETEKILIIDIIENQPPDLSQVKFSLINFESPLELSPNQNAPAVISEGTTYRLLKSIEDDLGLFSYTATWQKGQEQPVVVGQLSNINSTVVQFVLDPNTPTSQRVLLIVEEGTRAGTLYTLTIQAEDILGKTSEGIYYFLVAE